MRVKELRKPGRVVGRGFGGRGRGARAAYLEALEARVLLSVVFNGGAVEGTWGYAGMGSEGSIVFDGTGGISGGRLTNADGVTVTPSGSYTINSGGVVTVVTNTQQVVVQGTLVQETGETLVGQMDSSGDLMALTGGNLGSGKDTLTVLSKETGTSFGNSDLSGTWSLLVNGDDSSSTGEGTIGFDGNGTITGGGLVTTDGPSTIMSGNYTVSSAGVTIVNIVIRDADHSVKDLSFTGQLNTGMDTLAFDPANIANSNTGAKVVVAIKHTGTYTNASLNNTWGLVSDDVQGTITFNGAGKITGGGGTSGDGAFTLGGSYSVSSSGTFTMNILVNQGGGTKTIVEKGTLNSGNTFGAMEKTPQVQTATNDGSKDGLMFLVNPNNHAPTLTGYEPLALAATGAPFAFTFDFLLGSGNAADADGDALSLVITSLGQGTLSVDGNVVTAADLPLTVSSGDNLSWSAPAGADGSVQAFSVKATDGAATSGTAVPVLIDTVLTQAYGNTSVSGPWQLAGTGFAGTMEFGGDGTISGGLLVDDLGGTETPSGGYVVQDSGVMELLGSGNVTTEGAVNSARDVTAVSEGGEENFDVLVKRTDGDFSDADMAGTWTFGVNGPEASSNGFGTFIFDSAGHVTGGNYTIGTGVEAVTGGNYTVASDGSVNISANVKSKSGVVSAVTFVGGMNNSRDFVTMDPADLVAAKAAGASNLMLMVKSKGTYSNADLKGTWILDEVDGFNVIDFDGAGHLSSGGIVLGSYSVSSAGKVTVNITAGKGVFTGALNGGKNELVLNTASSSETNGLLLMTSTADHGPTVNATGVLPETALQTSVVTFSYNDLLTSIGAKDVDGDAISLQVTAATQNFGCLTILHNDARSAVQAGTVIVAGDTLELDTSGHASGKLGLLSVKASDGVLVSATAGAVVMNAAPLPVVTAVATVATAEDALVGNTAGNGVITLTRSGFMSSGNLSVKVDVGGTALPGSNYTLEDSNGETLVNGSMVTFLPGQTTVKINVVPQASDLFAATRTVVVTVDADPNAGHAQYAAGVGTKESATVTWFGQVPTVAIKAGVSSIKEGGVETFTVTRTLPRGLTSENTNVALSYTGSTFGQGPNQGDFISGPAIVSFTGKQTSATVVVTTNSDDVANPTETLVATIEGGNAVVGAGTSATVNVLDTAPIVTVKASKLKASELNPTTTGQGAFTFTRTGGDLTQTLNITVLLSGTAVNGTDYVTIPTTVMFAAKSATAVVTVTPNDTQLNNGTQTVTAAVVAGSLYHADATPATVTIQDVRIPPVSVAGDMFVATVTGGTENFAKSGGYTVVLSPTTNQYVMTNTASGVTSTGTYSYVVNGSTTAVLSLQGPPVSVSTTAFNMIFSTATSATFTFGVVELPDSQQTGKMTVIPAPAVQLAPTSVAGRTASAKVSAGTGDLANSGSFQLMLAQSSDSYVLVTQAPTLVGNSEGTYSYSVFAANLGVVTFDDSVTGNGTMYVLFTSATAASYSTISDNGTQRGTLALGAVPTQSFAPASASGHSGVLVVTGGDGPYATSGTFLIHLLATSYTITDTSGNVLSTGTYTYEEINGTTGVIAMNDSELGDETTVLSFSSAHGGSYVSLQDDGSGSERGRFTFD